MNANDLQVGTKVFLLKFKKGTTSKPGGYRRIGLFSVEAITDRMLRLRKDTGYIETINIIDLRQRRYRLQLEDSIEIRFKPMVDVMKVEREETSCSMEEYRKGTGAACYRNLMKKKGEGEEMSKMTKEAVKEMTGRGMTVKEIAEQFAESYPAMKMSMIMAKVTMLLNGKKQGVKKEKLIGTNTDIVIADEFAISDINSHEEHVETVIETEEYPEIAGIAGVANEAVVQKAKESIKKIDTAAEVDEMMEMVAADNINHPKHYTTGTIEVIDYLQDKMPTEMFEGFCVGNALKYLSRYRYKGGLEDLRKAQWYLDRVIKAKETA